MKKIGIISVEGKGARFATGQAVKARTIKSYFVKLHGDGQVYFANIDSAKKHPIRVLANMAKAFGECENIIFMPGQNIEVFAPVAWLMNVRRHRPVQYIVTGGDLAEVLRKKPFLCKYIASFAKTHVQSKKLAMELKDLGIANAAYLPNCRDAVDVEPFDHYGQEPLKVCTYSRVTKDKGILDAIQIVEKANALLGRKVFVLEVYGKLYDDFKEEFSRALAHSNGIASYEGVKDASETISLLRERFAILFPTYFACECFAGTALDAFAARIPIIANDWLYNSEVIEDGVNGFIYPFRDNEKAALDLVRLYKDKQLYALIQQGCAESNLRYSTSNVMGEFAKGLE